MVLYTHVYIFYMHINMYAYVIYRCMQYYQTSQQLDWCVARTACGMLFFRRASILVLMICSLNYIIYSVYVYAIRKYMQDMTVCTQHWQHMDGCLYQLHHLYVSNASTCMSLCCVWCNSFMSYLCICIHIPCIKMIWLSWGHFWKHVSW